MFVMLMITIVGTQMTTKEFPTRYRTHAECDAAIIGIAHQQVPALNSMIAFRCVREDAA